jgi:hypothetical protein
VQPTFRQICQDELPNIIHERQRLLRVKLMSGPEAVVAGCAAAIQSGLDLKATAQLGGTANVDAWRHKLQSDILSFCNNTVVSLLRAQQSLVDAQNALLGKQLEIERIKAESKTSGGTR